MTKIELTQTLRSILEDAVSLYAEDQSKVEYIQSILSESASPQMTKLGAAILKWLQENYETCKNTFTARQIGDGLFISGRSVSGAVKKLISLGYVNKQGNNPVCYSITEEGIAQRLD